MRFMFRFQVTIRQPISGNKDQEVTVVASTLEIAEAWIKAHYSTGERISYFGSTPIHVVISESP